MSFERMLIHHTEKIKGASQSLGMSLLLVYIWFDKLV